MGAERPWAVTGERERQILDGWGLSGPESEHLGPRPSPPSSHSGGQCPSPLPAIPAK